MMNEQTIYGYPVEDLVIFAEACRLAGVGPKEMKDLVYNIEAVYDIVAKAMDEYLVKSLNEYLKG